MIESYYSTELATIYCGDCISVMAELPENSIDAIVTDPPYGLEFMGKESDKLWRNKNDNDRLWIEG